MLYRRLHCRAEGCTFKHSPLPWGENIAMGYGTDPSKLADMWYSMEVGGQAAVQLYFSHWLP